MKNYLFRLNAPRPGFPADITPQEAALMQQHVAYWSAQMDKGRVLAFGPVADPRGSYGIALLQLDDDTDPAQLCQRDPIIAARIGFECEIHAMPRLVLPAVE